MRFGRRIQVDQLKTGTTKVEINSGLDFETVNVDQVLDVMRAIYGEADCKTHSAPERKLELTTTVEDWIYGWGVCYGVGDEGPPLSPLNRWWRFEMSIPEWRMLEERGEHHSVGDICAWIARRARRPAISSVTFFGLPCAPAAAFLAIREFFRREGITVRDLAPSTALAPYVRMKANLVYDFLKSLAPRQIPEPFVVGSWLERWTRRSIGTGIAFLLTSVIPLHVYLGWNPVSAFFVWGGLLLSIGVGAVATLVPRQGPDSVTYGDLRTFRDLAERIAAEGAAVRRA
jgi:hypothetical protein